jgi:hypothetical protein
MKIKKSEIKQIIKEETIKVKKLMVLKEEKRAIIKQLNELYEEDESINEGDELINLIPDTNDKQVVQQALTAPTQQSSQATSNGIMEEGLGGTIMDKINDLLTKLPTTDFPKLQQTLAPFMGKSYPDIYKMIKSKLSSTGMLQETDNQIENKKTLGEKIHEALFYICGVSSIGSLMVGLPLAVSIPTLIPAAAGVALVALVSAIVAVTIGLINKNLKNRKSYY